MTKHPYLERPYIETRVIWPVIIATGRQPDWLAIESHIHSVAETGDDWMILVPL